MADAHGACAHSAGRSRIVCSCAMDGRRASSVELDTLGQREQVRGATGAPGVVTCAVYSALHPRGWLAGRGERPCARAVHECHIRPRFHIE